MNEEEDRYNSMADLTQMVMVRQVEYGNGCNSFDEKMGLNVVDRPLEEKIDHSSNNQPSSAIRNREDFLQKTITFHNCSNLTKNFK